MVQRRQLLQILPRHGSSAVLDVVNECKQARVERSGKTVRGRRLNNGADLLIHLGFPFAHGQIPPHAALLLQRGPVEGDELVQAAPDAFPIAGVVEREGRRFVAVEALTQEPAPLPIACAH